METAQITKFQSILLPMRPPFLLLTPACIMVGVGAAVLETGQINLLQVLLVLVGGLAAHISVNALNEYFDFKSGLDFKTLKTPFSGGTGALPSRPEMASSALATGLITLGIAALVGIYFLFQRGWGLLPLGVLGLIVIYVYTLWLVRVPILSLVAPGLGFGPLMVLGTYFALTGNYSWMALIASLVPFFLVSDLLLLNQFPDAEPDQSIGRRHYPITLGRRKSSLIYGSFLLGAYVVILIGVITGLFPPLALIALLTLILAVPAALGAYRNADNLPALAQPMGFNVIINLVTPLLLGIGLLLGK